MKKLLVLFILVCFVFVTVYTDTFPIIGGACPFVKDFLNIYGLAVNIYPQS